VDPERESTRIKTESKILYKELAYRIVGTFYEVYNTLGPGFKEVIYHKALVIEFTLRKIPFMTNKKLSIKYKEKNVGIYEPDFIIDDKILIEIKAVSEMSEVYEKQLYYYLKGTEYKLGYLVNFGAGKLEIKRRIYEKIRENLRPSIRDHSRLTIYIDGASRGNPGPAGIGVIIYDEKKRLVDELCKYIGKTTNNVAEYQALLKALSQARSLGAETLIIYSDCELLVRQMAGEYRVKNKTLRNFYQRARANLKNFRKVNIRYIAREKNKKADRLANKGINLKGAGGCGG